jgi:hypothetical protein
MLAPAEWSAVGIAVTLLCALIARQVGWLSISLVRGNEALPMGRGAAKINSRVSITKFRPAELDTSIYVVKTTIYNDGETIARNLEGVWSLTASDGIHGTTQIIQAESLPPFFPVKLSHQVLGNAADLWTNPHGTLHVKIELQYSEPNGKPRHYEAAYDYEFKRKHLVARK